ncbi:hypothetical protein V3C99_003566 [Haemonchus contortus]
MDRLHKLTGIRPPRLRRLLRITFMCTLIAFLVLFFKADSSKRWIRQKTIVKREPTFEIDMFDYSMTKKHSMTPARTSDHEKIKVIVVPFTHTDPGWLKTFDSYSKDTDDTLDAMYEFFLTHPDMTFMWAETIFLEHWWRKQNDTVRNDIRKWVKQKRFDLVTGSWVMTDEANPYFPVSVDNIVEGFQFIHREFGVKPSVLFSLDPFGHSNSIAYLYSQAGVHREVINRISTDTKEYLRDLQAHRFIWRQYFDASDESDVWTHLLPYSHYDIPSSCGPNPNVCCEIDAIRYYKHYPCGGDMKPINKSNVKRKADALSTQLWKMSEQYGSNVVIMFYGDDFRLTTPFEWKVQYGALRLIFDEINSKNDIEISFGTITKFFDELEDWYAQNGTQPPSLKGDFFPYRLHDVGSWSGYYSTRPFYKSQERRLHWLLRAADLLSAQVEAGEQMLNTTVMLDKARRALLLFQHHDAITGTSRKHVHRDYSEQLHNATLLASSVIESSFGAIDDSTSEMVEYYMSNTNTTTLKVLNLTKEKDLTLKIINTLPYHLEDVISVRVDCTTIDVKLDGVSVEAQIEPYIRNGKIDSKTFSLVFQVRLQPLGIAFYRLLFDKNQTSTKLATISASTPGKVAGMNSAFQITDLGTEDFELSSSSITTVHNGSNGMVTDVIRKNKKEFYFRPTFLVYPSSGGAYEMSIRVDQRQEYFAQRPPSNVMVVKGPIQESAHIFAKGIYSSLTLKNVAGVLGDQLNYFFHIDVHFEHKQRSNKEFAFGFGTKMSFPSFYTDSLGIQLLRRKAGEFFPMPTSAVIEDNDVRITVSSNIPHGCRMEGSNFEAIIERIIRSDDGHGLGREPDAIPDDNLPVDMKFTILLEDLKQTDLDYSHYTVHTPAGHLSVQNTIYSPIVLFTSNVTSVPTSIEIPPLPCDLQLLTVRPLHDGRRLLTIFYHGIRPMSVTPSECGDDLQRFLRTYLESMDVKKVQETDLAGLDETAVVYNAGDYIPRLRPFKFLSLLLTI